MARKSAEKKYKEWAERRDKHETGFYCTVKLICDDCGKRWVDCVRLTLPPCPRCGGENVYEYETISVG